MSGYSNEDYCEMVLLYGEFGRNAREAARQYALRFPTDPHPTAWTISRAVRRLRETGCTAAHPRRGRPSGIGVHVQPVDVLAYVLANPQRSTREVSVACGLSPSRVWEILHQHGAHPYRAVPMQALMSGDNQRCLDWCNLAMITIEENPAFLSNILWTDEAQFTRAGVLNKRNTHYWSVTNPFFARVMRHQVRWSINVWCGIWKDRLVGPVFYKGPLTGRRYSELLRSTLTDWLDDVSLHDLRSMWFQHDGCPAHKPTVVQHFLSDTFGEKIIGYGGHVEWPPRSPDLTPMDFFLWDYLKDRVYAVEPTSLPDLKRRIVAACGSVTPVMLANVQQEVLSRIQMCIVADGGHIEHALR